MHSLEGRLTLVFNGAIYNFQALRRDLEARGHRFRSAGDAEVILALYREKGPALVHDLRGMFAFGLYDADRRGILLARDPFGIKPLYLADDGRTLRFASQVKALLAGGAVDRAPDPAGYAGFYLWGCVPEPHTLYRAIRALPAGTTLWHDASGSRGPAPFFDLSRAFCDAEAEKRTLAPAESRLRLQEAMRDTVRHHLVSHVPVALFLSGGLDSPTLAALAREMSAGELRTFTLGFREYRGTDLDETLPAGRISRRYRTLHRTCWVTRAGFLAHLERALTAMDQPSIDGINTYFVALAAAEAGIKVALSGVGGDELFGGYPGFRQVPRLARTMALARALPGLGRGVRKIVSSLVRDGASPKLTGLAEFGGSMAGAYLLRRALFMPWELPDLMGEEMAREGLAALATLERLEATLHRLRRSRSRMAVLELSWYLRNQLLRDADWAGMAHGVEIRTPLVDIGLFRDLVPLLAGSRPPGKREMVSSAVPPLPRDLLRRSKTGFNVPVPQWLPGAPGRGSPGRGLRDWAIRVMRASASEDRLQEGASPA
jgi:asparagine synthase (glutamine-hydrolysing)